MIDMIDKAIKDLTERSIARNNQDDVMKLTQSIVNLTHAKLNLLDYKRNLHGL